MCRAAIDDRTGTRPARFQCPNQAFGTVQELDIGQSSVLPDTDSGFPASFQGVGNLVGADPSAIEFLGYVFLDFAVQCGCLGALPFRLPPAAYLLVAVQPFATFPWARAGRA